MELDRIDRKILAAVQDDCRITAEKLGAQVNLSPSAAQRRLNALRQSGVIEKEVAVLSCKEIGIYNLLFIDVTLENETANDAREFKKRISNAPGVVQFYLVTGEVDYMIMFAASDMSEYEIFTEEMLFNDPFVKSFSTRVVVNSIKSGQQYPITE